MEGEHMGAIPNGLTIRDSVKADVAAIESLYPAAFPEEDLVPLVNSLLREPKIALSLVAAIDSEIAANVIFTRCGVEGRDVEAALRGPLAVAPEWQKQGIGTAIVGAGLRRLQDARVGLVLVLGDPAYYGGLGFSPESLVEPPYALPPEWAGAWQSQYLGDNAGPCAGKLSVPPQWLDPALWAP